MTAWQMLKPLFYVLTDVMSTVAGGTATETDAVQSELLVIVGNILGDRWNSHVW